MLSLLSLTLVDADTVQGRSESLSPSQVYCSSKAWIGSSSSSSNSVVAYSMGKASHCEGMRCIVRVRGRVGATVRARLRVRLRVRLWLWLTLR